jgi:hypothetical protein
MIGSGAPVGPDAGPGGRRGILVAPATRPGTGVARVHGAQDGAPGDDDEEGNGAGRGSPPEPPVSGR